MHVQELVLDGCGGLTAVSLSGHWTLRTLSLLGCRGISSLDVRCRRLSTLRLGQVRWLQPFIYLEADKLVLLLRAV